jgi:predicted RNase H-like HicB family nuclease
MESICTFDGYPELKEIHFIASTKSKAEKMGKAAIQLGLSRQWKSNTPIEAKNDDAAENHILALDNHTSFEQKCEEKCVEYISGADHVEDEEVAELQIEEPPSSGSYENLDILGRLVRRAAVDHNLQFRASTGEMIPCDLRLQNPVTPSELTLDTYFRRDMRSTENEPLANTDVSRTYPIDHEINTTRLNLSAVVECIVIKPIRLPQNYVEMVKTDTVIGGGYFGEVRLGIDRSLGIQFAVKLIKPLVIEQALSSQLQSIQKSFQNEIEVLSRLRHPNIAPLYGYCMEESGLTNTCLLYEFAANGSLDKFWATDGNENMLSRERLSDPRVRTRIALEVATVLRYMHEGLPENTKCFHRDIKSANICLCSDFSARVVDCGLAKYVTEEAGSFSTAGKTMQCPSSFWSTFQLTPIFNAGPTGTPGYTCPQVSTITVCK